MLENLTAKLVKNTSQFIISTHIKRIEIPSDQIELDNPKKVNNQKKQKSVNLSTTIIKGENHLRYVKVKKKKLFQNREVQTQEKWKRN